MQVVVRAVIDAVDTVVPLRSSEIERLAVTQELEDRDQVLGDELLALGRRGAGRGLVQRGCAPWPCRSTACTSNAGRNRAASASHCRAEAPLECSSTTVGREVGEGVAALMTR